MEKSIRRNVVREKSFGFALRVVKLYRYLSDEKRELVLSKQVLRSGTAIGALQRESEHAESESDFIHKLSIAQKECNETLYWIELLYRSGYLDETAFKSLYKDGDEIMRILTSIIKSKKQNKEKRKKL